MNLKKELVKSLREDNGFRNEIKFLLDIEDNQFSNYYIIEKTD